MKIEHKNIILTGASSGIGQELLKLLLGYEGVAVVAVARHVDAIDPIEGRLYPFSADLSKPEGIDSLFDFASETLGTIDIFIANAGYAYIEQLSEADWGHIEDIYSLNVFSPIYSLQKLVSTSCGTPRVFACTISGAALVSLPYYSLYCSSKSALHHFVETFRYEQPADLQLSAIYPVATRTAFFDKAKGASGTPLPFPQQSAEVVARKIVRGIEKGKKRIYPSALFGVFYPIGRAFPFLLNIYSLLEKRKWRQKI